MTPYQLARLRQLFPLAQQGQLKDAATFTEYQDLIQSFSQTYYGRIDGLGPEKAEIEEFLSKNDDYLTYLITLETTLQTELNPTTIVALARDNLVADYRKTQEKLFPESLDPNNPQAIRQRIARDDAFIEILLQNARARLRSQALKITPPGSANLQVPQEVLHAQAQEIVISATQEELIPRISPKYTPLSPIPPALLAYQPLGSQNLRASLIPPTETDLKKRHYDLHKDQDTPLFKDSHDLVAFAQQQGLSIKNPDYTTQKLNLLLEAGLLSETDLSSPTGPLKLSHLIDYYGKQIEPTPTPPRHTPYHEPNPVEFTVYEESQVEKLKEKHLVLVKETLSPQQKQDLLTLTTNEQTDLLNLSLLFTEKKDRQIHDLPSKTTPISGSLTPIASSLFLGTPVSLLTTPVLSRLLTAMNADKLPAGLLPVAAVTTKEAAANHHLKNVYQARPHQTLGAHPDYYQLISSRIIWQQLKKHAKDNPDGEVAKYFKDNPFLVRFIDQQHQEIFSPPGSVILQSQQAIHSDLKINFVNPNSPLAVPLTFLSNPKYFLNNLTGKRKADKAKKDSGLASAIALSIITPDPITISALSWAGKQGLLPSGLAPSLKTALPSAGLPKAATATAGLLRGAAKAPLAGSTGLLGGLGNLSTSIGNMYTLGPIVTPLAIGSAIGFIVFFFIPIINIAPILTTLVHLEGGNIGFGGSGPLKPPKFIPESCPAGYPTNVTFITQGPNVGTHTIDFTVSVGGSAFRSQYQAVDFATPLGTSVRTTHDGQIYHMNQGTAPNSGLGNHAAVIATCQGVTFITLYAHMLPLPGQGGPYQVVKGDEIGLSGQSGTLGDGPHLHYEIMSLGQPFDILEWLER